MEHSSEHIIKVTELIRQELNTGAPLELAVSKAMMKTMKTKEEPEEEPEED